MLPVIVIAIALPVVTAITYLVAYIRPEPVPNRKTGAVR